MLRLFVVLLLITGAGDLRAQSINEDPLITRMMQDFIRFNRAHQTVRGWRVQVLVTTDRRQMEGTRARFERLYPEYKLTFAHENPFYHLKTGAFQTRERARPFLRALRKDFPSAFLVADEVEVSEILTYQ
ncbi:MAG: SPOR domain-containing protein [Saprospiraceae bacterium]|nr:SPOR domain-containing protein [Saprospiraceae bacterium]